MNVVIVFFSSIIALIFLLLEKIFHVLSDIFKGGYESLDKTLRVLLVVAELLAILFSILLIYMSATSSEVAIQTGGVIGAIAEAFLIIVFGGLLFLMTYSVLLTIFGYLIVIIGVVFGLVSDFFNIIFLYFFGIIQRRVDKY